MSAVLPLTLRLRLKRGKTLQDPRMTAEEARSATAALLKPSREATLTAVA